MKRVLKWLGILLGAVVALVAAVALYVVVASQRVVARTYDVPLTDFNAPSDPESVRRGERLATIYGCNNCHGRELQGTVMFDKPNIARIAAPNITTLVKQYTDAELERLIRHGVKRDGTSTWIMPAVMFRHLTDADLADVMAYVRSVPDRDGVEPELTLRTIGRIGVLTEKFKPSAVAAAEPAARVAPDASDPLAQGRYLVMTACTECHGTKLEGSPLVPAPGLAVIAAYSEEDFFKLMRHGVGAGNRELGLMGRVGRARFASLRDDEVRSIRNYLNEFVARGATSPP